MLLSRIASSPSRHLQAMLVFATHRWRTMSYRTKEWLCYMWIGRKSRDITWHLNFWQSARHWWWIRLVSEGSNWKDPVDWVGAMENIPVPASLLWVELYRQPRNRYADHCYRWQPSCHVNNFKNLYVQVPVENGCFFYWFQSLGVRKGVITLKI